MFDLSSDEAQVRPLDVDPGREGLDLPCSVGDGGQLLDLPSGEAQVCPLAVDPGREGLDRPCWGGDGGQLFDLPSGEAQVGPLVVDLQRAQTGPQVSSVLAGYGPGARNDAQRHRARTHVGCSRLQWRGLEAVAPFQEWKQKVGGNMVLYSTLVKGFAAAGRSAEAMGCGRISVPRAGR